MRWCTSPSSSRVALSTADGLDDRALWTTSIRPCFRQCSTSRTEVSRDVADSHGSSAAGPGHAHRWLRGRGADVGARCCRTSRCAVPPFSRVWSVLSQVPVFRLPTAQRWKRRHAGNAVRTIVFPAFVAIACHRGRPGRAIPMLKDQIQVDGEVANSPRWTCQAAQQSFALTQAPHRSG